MTNSGRPALASDDWMLEQQVRAELEAEAWRRLRADLALAAPAPAAELAAPAAAPPDYHRAGSAMLKGLARFALAAFAAYLAYLAAVDGGLGEFEIWLAVGGAFASALALSMFGAARRLVHIMAETMRWVLIAGAALGAAWLMLQMSA